MTASIEEALAFKPESREAAAKSYKLLNKYFSPTFVGLDNINASKPTLFVGNHTRYGLLDVPLMNQGIYTHTGLYPRGLADRLHYNIPTWRDTLGKQGGVLGSREMCRALMGAGESIIVFPGGAGEVVKGKGTNYKLLWKERVGFVRMALESGYSITPFSSVGADNALDVVIGGDEVLDSFASKVLKGLGLDLKKLLRGGEFLPPISRGVGLTSIPRPEPFYFSFGKPIETAGYKGRHEDIKLLKRLKEKTANAVNSLLKDGMLLRAQEQGNHSLLRRLMLRS